MEHDIDDGSVLVIAMYGGDFMSPTAPPKIDGVHIFYLASGASNDYLRDHFDRCWLLRLGERIAGFAVCEADLIDLMMIDVALHRRGLGTALLQYCEQRLFQQCDQIRLEDFAGNEPANAFYDDVLLPTLMYVGGFAAAGALLVYLWIPPVPHPRYRGR